MNDLSSHMTFLEHMIDGGLKYLTVMGTMHEIGYWEGAIDENTPCMEHQELQKQRFLQSAPL